MSADGHWIAYNTTESGRWEVYVATFPGFNKKRQVSNNGGTQALWRRDGKELFYIALDGKLMAAEVTLKGSSIDVGQVKPLGITVPTTLGFANPYDVSLDGQRILAITDPEHTSSTPLTLIQNWTSLLKK